MSIVLTPNIYDKDFQWNIRSKNIIDSVVFTPLVGDINEETSTVHTETFTHVSIQNGNNNVSLPITDDTPATYWRYMSNVHLATFVQVEYAKARIESVMASGSKRITLEKALPEVPGVSIQLLGNSYMIDRGGATFDSYPTLSDIRNKAFNLTSWIKSNHVTKNANLLWDYTDNKFSMNPWVRKFVPITEQTLANDILTTWGYYSSYYPGFLSHSFPDKSSWIDQPSFGNVSQLSPISMNPVQPMYGNTLVGGPEIYTGSNIPADNALVMYDLNIPMKCSIRKIDDFTFDIDWVAPVRLSYLAASRTRSTTGTNTDLDNYAFVDEVTQVNIVLTGRQFNTDTYSETYTKNALSEHPLKIDETPFLTSRTYYGTSDNKWGKVLADKLLDKYSKGKYIIKCKVPMSWILEHNMSVGSTINIQLQDGNFITRGNEICTFKIHNIEVTYQPSSFKSILTLMEV